MVSIDSIKNYYQGQKLPFDELSPEDFERFVFACLLCIQDTLGLRISGQPSGPGDGGFDVQGNVLATNRLCCIQCKRYNSPLDVHTLVQELAKTSAVSVLENSDIGEHRIICSGKVRTKLRNLLRQKDLESLAIQTGDLLATSANPQLSGLRDKLKIKNFEPRTTAENYVRRLDTLTVWDIHEFDSALSARWPDVLNVAERFFRIATVVREHPRAHFDRQLYLDQYSNFSLPIEPRLLAADLPSGILSSASISSNVNLEKKSPRDLHGISNLPAGELLLIRGEGGIGKSTALKAIAAYTARSSPLSVLPIIIGLAGYTVGGLDRLINQAIGVDHGTWRSLPDHILLLCDGLNECPQEHLPQLLEELDPLLRRKKIACIISTRDAIRHQKITLPISDGACLKIAELTPNDISTLASRAFDNAEEVRDFLHSYRSLADASNSVHLWTPFAVEVGIALWREKSSLPLTIGQMISAVLKGRAEKNQDRLPRYVNAQVVLNLAAALAFELLVTDGRLERDPLNAGKWFNAAKSHCKDALGVSELSDNDILTLLARHELLFVSANGSISFGHQLTAGALAAVFLAKNWKANLSCLGNPVTDDAWIFAANLVKLEESREYIQKLLEVDLILGARATREVGQGIHDEIKNTFSAIAQSNHSQEIRIRGIFALATLGGDGSLLTLKHLARDNDREIAFQAKRGLAVAGDRKFLKHVLEEVDYLRSSPVQHSGGLVSVWDSANLPIKLDLARERLTSCTPGQDVNESFLLLAWEANSYDTDLIESHLRGARDHNAYYFGLYALNQINPQRAKQFVTEGLNESLPALKKIQDILAAGMNGINLDQKFLYQTAISNGSNEENTEELIRGQHLLIERVILKNPIAQDVIQKLEQDLPPSTGNMRQNLWHIALGCRSEKIARYALNIIQDWSDSNDAINACNFLNAQSDLAKKQKKLINLCEIQVEKDNLNSWQLCGIYELIGTLGFSEISANLLNKRIEELSKIRIALEEDRIASLPAATLAILMREPGADLSNSKYAVERMMANCIPAANNAKRFLPKKSLLSLLHTPAGHYSVEADQKNMVSQLSPKEIDEEIQLIKDFWTSLNVVANLSKLGTTQVRISVLRKALQTHYTIPSALNELCRAVDAGWSPDVLRMVVEEVAAIDTWQHSQDFFWDFVEVVARHISADDLKAIHSELPKAKTSFARRILGLWRDYAAGERIGLVRINEPLTSQ